MRTTIDSAGRLVVPKALRDQLGLRGGATLEISARDGRLEVEVAATPMQLESRGNALVAVAEGPIPTLTAEAVREALERVRR